MIEEKITKGKEIKENSLGMICLQNIFSYLNQMMQKLSWIECESAKNLVKSNSFERLNPHFISN